MVFCSKKSGGSGVETIALSLRISVLLSIAHIVRDVEHARRIFADEEVGYAYADVGESMQYIRIELLSKLSYGLAKLLPIIYH